MVTNMDQGSKWTWQGHLGTAQPHLVLTWHILTSLIRGSPFRTNGMRWSKLVQSMVTMKSPWIQGHSISSLDAKRCWMDDWEGLWSSSHGSVTWQSAKLALGGAGRLLGGVGLWAQVALTRPLASLVHVCHHFGLFFLYFLHTNNSTSTSGTRWNWNKILHMWWWFTSLYHAFGWNVDGQNGC